jgi:hypothetical protein
MLQLLLFSGLAFFLLLKRTLTITLDTDWLCRRIARRVRRDVEHASFDGAGARAVVRGAPRHVSLNAIPAR